MKILVNITVPAISECYDVLIPDFLSITELVPLIAEAVEELSDHVYISSKHEFLCLPGKDLLLMQEKTLSQYGVKNGDYLLMI